MMGETDMAYSVEARMEQIQKRVDLPGLLSCSALQCCLLYAALSHL